MINFKDILEKQKQLDESYYMNYPDEIKNNLYEKHEVVVIALLAEVFELANELEFNKPWKLNKLYDKDKIIEELGDVICFWASLSNLRVELAQEKNHDTSKIDEFYDVLNAQASEVLHYVPGGDKCDFRDFDDMYRTYYINLIAKPQDIATWVFMIIVIVCYQYDLTFNKVYDLAYDKNIKRIENRY